MDKENTLGIPEPGAIKFCPWRHWSLRDTTKPDLPWDPPRNYDHGGVYLLAHFPKMPPSGDEWSDVKHLSDDVIYIGMSTRITGRLEGENHSNVRKNYRAKFGDRSLARLYFSNWFSDWNSDELRRVGIGKAKTAYLHFVERKLIWEYAYKFERLPILNSV
jgi:hypothetical protein